MSFLKKVFAIKILYYIALLISPKNKKMSQFSTSLLHSPQKSKFTGMYQLTDKALSNYKTTREKFGTTDIILSAEKSFNVKDYQYLLEDGTIGMHLLPVHEYGTFKDHKGNDTWASYIVDSFIREKTCLTDDDPIYALVYYIHPELNSNTLQGFAATEKTEMGVTHLGAYLGQGVTSNSPPLYHNKKWGVVGSTYGYPCNLMWLSLEGVNQGTLNKNLQLTDSFLNYGVRFPVDYKNSTFRMAELNTCLMFYKDWIFEESYLKTDSTWFTYCAAHKTLVTTVALNLPHNLESFKETYGDANGADFYAKFCSNYFALYGEDFTTDKETYFEPLWKKEGWTKEQIKPFTKEEYYAYDEARRSNSLSTFKGFIPLKPDQATAWAPQQTSEIILNFIELYANFLNAGAIVTCATIMAYKDQVTKRMGISELEYLHFSMPIISTIMMADAKANASKEGLVGYENSIYIKKSFEALYLSFGGDSQAIPDFNSPFAQFDENSKNLEAFVNYLINNTNSPESLALWALRNVKVHWTELNASEGISMQEANSWLNDQLQTVFEDTLNIVAASPTGIQYNTPPCIAHMIELGLFKKNSRVGLKTICTVMDQSELEPKV